MVGYVIKDKIKRVFSIMVITIMFAFMIVLVTGCENNEQEKQPEEVVKRTYNVTFDSAGGSEVVSQTITEGEIVTKPVTPTKEGYEFTSWTYNGERYNFSTPVTSDITLVAEWAKKEEVWVVTLDTDDGSLTTKVNVKKGEKLAKPEDPERAGYTFVSWQLNGKDYDFNKIVEKDITLKAVWKERKLKVTFDSAGGSAVKTQEIKLNGTATEPKTKPTKAGWTFVEWQFEGNKYDFKTEVKDDITLMAIWKLAKTYTKEESTTKKINGKNVKLDFRYYVSGNDKSIDMFVSDIKAYTLSIDVEKNEDDCWMGECTPDISKYLKELKDRFTIIKGDKEYFLFKTVILDTIVISDTGTLVYKRSFNSGGAGPELLEASCLNYNKDFYNHHIANDAIYYLEPYTDLQVKQQKVTFSKNKATTTTVAICPGVFAEKGETNYLYIITKTKKVNGKNVNLEYRFNADIDTETITADLYINNKKIVEEIYSDFTFDMIDEGEEDIFEKVIYPFYENQEDINISMKYWNDLSNTLDKKIGTIKSDKEYLYVFDYDVHMGDAHLIVLNSNNAVIFKKTIHQYVTALQIDKLCPNIQIFSNGTDNVREVERFGVINNNAIYYFNGTTNEEIDLTEHTPLFGNNESEWPKIPDDLEKFVQYKAEFKNDKAIITKVGVCVGYHEGQREIEW